MEEKKISVFEKEEVNWVGTIGVMIIMVIIGFILVMVVTHGMSREDEQY